MAGREGVRDRYFSIVDDVSKPNDIGKVREAKVRGHFKAVDEFGNDTASQPPQQRGVLAISKMCPFLFFQ